MSFMNEPILKLDKIVIKIEIEISITTALKSIVKLVKLPSLVVKCCKMQKIQPCKVCKLCPFLIASGSDTINRYKFSMHNP